MRTTLISALAMAASLTGAGYGQQAGEDHNAHHGEQGTMQSADSDSGRHEHMMMGGMDMSAHQEQMSRMRELMVQARNTEDPEERRRLMEQHDELMQAHMDTMMDDGEHMAMMMRHCGQRMSMMHDMMEQMRARHEMMEGPANAEAGE
ncbi:hypothetical protein E5163_10265 [Marinicauda algicola]|uniref:Uncharacterized protein n=1 Tax=Marinicauda algicola TaxID=2029849 RepID=A0A4S2GYE6_9PROT|nr:hypothetical protein [Marinicauda algicola]TGY88207.1 hypothetical protein E5163_10265 [Marinicauda algicola]